MREAIIRRLQLLLDVSTDVPPSRQLTNVFLGLRPVQTVAGDVRIAADRICDARKITGPRRPAHILHATVLQVWSNLGRMPRKSLEIFDTAISQINFPTVDLRFDEALSFSSRNTSAPFVLTDSDGATDAIALYLAARDALLVRDLKIPAARRIVPHMTIAYDRRRSFKGRIDPLCWRASELQLIESWVGQTKYVQLASWPLRDDGFWPKTKLG